MTETCGIVSVEDPNAGSRHSGSTGMLVPGMECVIASVETLKPLPPNQLGEIWLRGQNVMQGILTIRKLLYLYMLCVCVLHNKLMIS